MLKDYWNILIESCGTARAIMGMLCLVAFLISVSITLILIIKFFLKGCKDYEI